MPGWGHLRGNRDGGVCREGDTQRQVAALRRPPRPSACSKAHMAAACPHLLRCYVKASAHQLPSHNKAAARHVMPGMFMLNLRMALHGGPMCPHLLPCRAPSCPQTP